MFRGSFYTFFISTSLLVFTFCNNVTQPEEIKYGSVSGKILYPADSILTIRLVSEDGNLDTTSRDPVSKIFTFDSVKTGMCILQIFSNGYGFQEQKFVLKSRQLICHDIILARTPSAVSYLFPSNSQNLDSTFFRTGDAAITDTGIQIAVTFNDEMDSATFMKVISIRPDTVGVNTTLLLRRSFVVFFPYWKLATVDTVRITIGRGATDQWGNPFECDYSIFFPVDTEYIRATRLSKK